MLLTLKNAWIADGSGGEFFRADLAIQGDRIAEIGSVSDESHYEQIDCEGLIVAPGFIDAHSHSDLQVLDNRREKLLQGVTCEVVGNCGFSAYPMASGENLRQFGNGILNGEGDWGWRSASNYLRAVHERAQLASVESLVGHGSLRIAHAGTAHAPLEERTISALEGTLDEALAEGAAGFSTGLMYAPGSSAPSSELIRLCKVVARRGKIHCSHIRDYSTHLLAAIDEQIELAEQSGCRLQISHLQAVGRSNWKLNRLALDRIEGSRNRGIDVMFDCYPYLAGSTVLTQLLPQWTLDGGLERMTERLLQSGTRREIAKEVSDALVHQWDEIFISAVGSAKNAFCVGLSIDELAKQRGSDPLDAVFDLLVEEKGQVNMLQFNQSDDNLRANLTHPLAIVISDGFYVKGRPHPRLHGTFPELLGNICRDRKWLTLPEAIHKVTGLPATRFAIKNRGYLRPRYFADLTIFDASVVRSNASYQKPDVEPSGIAAVFREGKLLLAQDVRFSSKGAHQVR